MFRELDGVQTIVQLLTVFGEVEEPLTHSLLLHRAVAAPTPSGLDLFIGEHGRAGRTPIDRCKFAASEPLFVEFGEKPLIPAVVPRIVALHRSTPIVREPHALDLLRDGGHVAFGDVVGMATLGNGGVFGRHAKGIETHRVEDIEAPHAFVAGHGVTDGVVSNVTHVHFSGRVRVHFQTVERGATFANFSVEEAGVGPFLLPSNLVNAGLLCGHEGVLLQDG